MNCKNCGSQVNEGSKFCENCGSPMTTEVTAEYTQAESTKAPEITTAQKIKKALKLLCICFAAVFAFVFVFVTFSDDSTSYSSGNDDDYIRCAITVVQKQLVSPGSAVYSNETVVEHDDYGRVLVTLTVDSQNRMGAMLRSHYAVVVYNYNPEEDSFSYNRAAVQSWSDQYDFLADEVMNQVKITSNWGIPFEEDTTEAA